MKETTVVAASTATVVLAGLVYAARVWLRPYVKPIHLGRLTT